MTRYSEYELVFIAHPDLDEEGVAALTAQVRGWIEAAGGEVIHTTQWGRRKLAYPIRKQTEGSYVLMWASMPRQAIRGLERELKLAENVLRHLLVRAETPFPVSEAPPEMEPVAAPESPAEPAPDQEQQGEPPEPSSPEE